MLRLPHEGRLIQHHDEAPDADDHGAQTDDSVRVDLHHAHGAALLDRAASRGNRRIDENAPTTSSASHRLSMDPRAGSTRPGGPFAPGFRAEARRIAEARRNCAPGRALSIGARVLPSTAPRGF